MIETLAVRNYRSLYSIVMPLNQLTLLTGANGVGKSNLYSALRLLVSATQGEVISALAKQGGLTQAMWAGPTVISRAMELGEVPIQGGPTQKPVRLSLGFSSQEFGYLLELGLPEPQKSAFKFDPVIKRECIWHGTTWRAASCLVDRKGPHLKRRVGRQWQTVTSRLAQHESLFDFAGDPESVPEVFNLRETIRQWRFYADFRTDSEAPARQTHIATRTPVMHHDGHDLAAALQTINEIGDAAALSVTIDDAFPGSELVISQQESGHLRLGLMQPGMLRALNCSEWSDGTLRYMLLAAALLTPRPPPLMVLNEPETSLHPDLIAPLARLIMKASDHTQIWVISHSHTLVRRLECAPHVQYLALEKSLGRTELSGFRELDLPPWRWP